jgi:transcriptional regulator with XRE-family HTH domain
MENQDGAMVAAPRIGAPMDDGGAAAGGDAPAEGGAGKARPAGSKAHRPIAPDVADRRRRRQLAIAAVIRKARRARHMVQTELAGAANISHGHLGRLESTTGATTYDLTLLRMWDILDALGLTWGEWEREVAAEMAGGVPAQPTRRDTSVALLARIVRTLPDDHIDLLVSFARTLERHNVSLANTPGADATWVRQADDAARAAGLERIDEALGFGTAGEEGVRRKGRGRQGA